MKEIADIIEVESETKVAVEEDSNNTSQGKIMTSLEETTKVKELYRTCQVIKIAEKGTIFNYRHNDDDDDSYANINKIR